MALHPLNMSTGVLVRSRYGDVVSEAVLGDLPPADEQASHRIVEARLLYRDWNVFWSRHEYYAQSQVRAGWVNTVRLDTARGRTTMRMPGGEDYYEGQEQETTRYLIISDTADYWPVQTDQPEEGKEEAEGTTDGMDTESGGLR